MIPNPGVQRHNPSDHAAVGAAPGHGRDTGGGEQKQRIAELAQQDAEQRHPVRSEDVQPPGSSSVRLRAHGATGRPSRRSTTPAADMGGSGVKVQAPAPRAGRTRRHVPVLGAPAADVA